MGIAEIMAIAAVIGSVIAILTFRHQVRSKMKENMPYVRTRFAEVQGDTVLAVIDIFPTKHTLPIRKISSDARGMAIFENGGFGDIVKIRYEKNIVIHADLPPYDIYKDPVSLTFSFKLKNGQDTIRMSLYKSRSWFAIPYNLHTIIVVDTK